MAQPMQLVLDAFLLLNPALNIVNRPVFQPAGIQISVQQLQPPQQHPAGVFVGLDQFIILLVCHPLSILSFVIFRTTIQDGGKMRAKTGVKLVH